MPGEAHDPYAALRSPNFRRLWAANICSGLGLEMLTLAVGVELYDRTSKAVALGLVGLVQFVPVLLFALPAGVMADRFNRKRQFALAQCVAAGAACSLAFLSRTGSPIFWMYVALAVLGTARAFTAPARQSLLPHMVPPEALTNAVAWNSGGWQMASTLGPVLGGAILAISHYSIAYFVAAGFCAAGALLMSLTKPRPVAAPKGVHDFRSLVAGIKFVWNTKLILAAITLDLFAVLFGGAVALLPIYAKDILNLGPTGLGWLRAATPIGAIAMAIILAHRPPLRRAGRTLLISVIGFGIATIVFGLSRNALLSFAALAVAGALDNISIVVRGTLMQVLTPDSMRGRVSAVTTIFIYSSNELGMFESGITAAWFGPVGASWLAASAR